MPAKPLNHRASPVGLSVTASEAKNRFGPLLEEAIKGRSIVITKHDAPKAVLMSIAEFETLSRAREPNLNALREEFDAMLDGMQTPKSRAGMKAAFDATPGAGVRRAAPKVRRRG